MPVKRSRIPVYSISGIKSAPRGARKAASVLRLLHIPVVEKTSGSMYILVTEHETVSRILKDSSFSFIEVNVLDTHGMTAREVKKLHIRLNILDAGYQARRVDSVLREISRDSDMQECLREDLMPESKNFSYTRLHKDRTFGAAPGASSATIHRHMKRGSPAIRTAHATRRRAASNVRSRRRPAKRATQMALFSEAEEENNDG